MEEVWKSIDGYEGYYQVSNYGNVRSVDRLIPHRTHQNGCIWLKGKDVAQINVRGYRKVGLYKDGKSKLVFVHRLVAASFIQNLENKPQINHKNGNPSDNKYSNLEWCTAKENVKHSWDTGLCKIRKGTDLVHSKTNETEVAEIKMLIRSGMTRKDIFKTQKFNCSYSSIVNIGLGLSWSHVK